MTKEKLNQLQHIFNVAAIRLILWMALGMFSVLPTVGNSPVPKSIGIVVMVLGTVIGLGGLLYNGAIMADAEEQMHIVARNLYHEHKSGCTGQQPIQVVEEKYSPMRIASGNWGMGIYANTLVYEHTQCPECRSQMVWTKSEGLKSFIPRN